nr:HAD-IA family hydrolase [Phycisphaerae bacterium]NIX00215.1 HAD-IA family hydrolase [Phycisphaerae bacterium]NIX29832.1 HAD-IA family hydrolase [Phycisphaerae bacterium]
KPDPEIYNLLTEELRISHSEGLAIEDSSNGIKAALTANISCVAVPSDFTRAGVHKLPTNDNLRVVDNPPDLLETVKEFISEINSDEEGVN